MGISGQLLLVFCATLPIAACARNDPPGIRATAPEATRGVRVEASTPIVPEPIAPSDAGQPRSLAMAVAGSSVGSAATGHPVPERQKKADESEEPPLVDAAGQPLPQTDVRPIADSRSFQRRAERLCQAIIEAEPAKAHDAFFPLLAYSQVKAVADPARDYRLRLLAHFDRDVLEYHRRIAKRPGPYRCAGITVPETLARWMKPGSEYNKLGYYRVLRSHLRILDASEQAISFEVTSLISWRGEWYVVHLNGFE